ncbi:hypothetical protein [Streptomyces sp. DH37]|nr:hypothetical protein [Streptomyces sp. DH37]MDG9702895.1 hypothetical protein [Streptomyces sp. DH37]
MKWLVWLLLIAVVLAVLGLVVKALKWMLIIAAVVFVAGLVTGWVKQRK